MFSATGKFFRSCCDLQLIRICAKRIGKIFLTKREKKAGTTFLSTDKMSLSRQFPENINDKFSLIQVGISRQQMPFAFSYHFFCKWQFR